MNASSTSPNENWVPNQSKNSFIFSEARQVSILHAAYVIPNEGAESGIAAAAKTGFGKMARMYAKWKEEAQDGTLSELVRTIVEESGYWDMLETSVDEQTKQDWKILKN